MVAPAILTIATVMLPLLAPAPTRDCQFGRMGDPLADQQALATFEAAVNDYVDLHRRLERGWSSFWFISDPEQVEGAAAEFRRVLRDARPHATPGSFFASDVADVFRFRVGRTLRQSNLDIAAFDIYSEDGETTGWWTPVVNEPLPIGAVGAFGWIVEALPLLPFELEYRLIGRDLALVDVHANMVLDVLDLALPVAPGFLDDDRPLDDFEEERPPYLEQEQPIRPLGEEFMGCLHGQVL
jgi:hypothetical protein